MRVIVAEDNFLRDLLVRILPEYGLQVIGAARTTHELLRLVDIDPPDIVTLDISMPRCDPEADPEYAAGVDAAKEIRRRHPQVAIVALSQHSQLRWAEEIAALGMAVGYQLKDRVQDMNVLVEVMKAVAGGDIRVDKTLVAALFARKRLNDPVKTLSPRESEVLQLIAEGLSNSAIAERLFIREGTVEGHETAIYGKLRLSSRRGASGKAETNLRVLAVLAFLKSGRVHHAEQEP